MTPSPSDDAISVLRRAVHHGKIHTGADGFFECLDRGYITKTLITPYRHRLDITHLGRCVLADHEGEG